MTSRPGDALLTVQGTAPLDAAPLDAIRGLLEASMGLPTPWRIERVDLRLTESCLSVRVGHAADASWPCPRCDVVSPCHDHGMEREWRHLDFCQCRLLLHASVPRVACPRHGVAEVTVPWAETGSRYTSAMAHHIGSLAAIGGVGEASRALDIRWEDAWRLLMARRVGV